jgi:thiamine pyrophosphate-dependent acetolactate synthase large subunit-like protein
MSDAMTGGELAVRSLAAHGVELVFGIPGTHNLELYAHFERCGIRHASPRHEQGAGYAADGYARASGRPGVAVTTAGPAAMNIAAAAGQAQSDSVPLLVLAPGMPRAHPAASSGYLHEMPSQQRAMSGVVERSVRVMSHAELGREVADAFAAFRSRRPRARYVEVPLDLLAEAAEAEVPVAPDVPPQPPSARAVAEAAALLRGAERPGVIAGGGAAGAADALLALAGRLGAPVITTANGKGTIPDDHPLALGARINYAPVRAWLESCDVVLAVGTELGESDLWGPPLALSGRLVRVDVDPAQAHSNNVAAVAVVADARTALESLADALSAVPARGAAAQTGASAAPTGSSAAPTSGPRRAAEVRAALEPELRRQAAPWLEWLAAIDGVLGRDSIVAGDSAMCCYYGALAALPARRPRSFLYPAGFGTLGYAVPAATGAALACPDRRVLALSGDGGIMFTLPELAAAAALRLALPVVVFVNEGYGEIRKEMVEAGNAPVGVDLPPPDLPAAARALGCAGTHAADPQALASEISAAFERRAPTLITVPEV